MADENHKFIKFNELISKRKPLLLDGATGSMLIAKGLKMGDCPELWNLHEHEKVSEIAKAYFEAGSDIVLTNTFGASALRLAHFQLDHITEQINYAGTKAVLDVKPRHCFVFGSIGPSGHFLEPVGKVSESLMIQSFVKQVIGLVKAGVDGFMLETFSDLKELGCAIRAVNEISDLPFFCTMTFTYRASGFCTAMGVSVKDAIWALSDSGALAIGANCGNGIEQMMLLAKEFRMKSKTMDFIFKANAGEPILSEGKAVYKESLEDFVHFSREILKLKPLAIGGCCGTTPQHISRLRRLISVEF